MILEMTFHFTVHLQSLSTLASSKSFAKVLSVFFCYSVVYLFTLKFEVSQAKGVKYDFGCWLSGVFFNCLYIVFS